MKRPRSYYLLFLIIIILITGIAAVVYGTYQKNQELRQSLINRTQTIAAAVPQDRVAELKGNESDLDSADYLAIKDQLTRIKAANTDIRFIYITGKNSNGELFFMVDSEDPASDGYSPPGQEYPEATDAFKNSFESQQAFIEGPVSDRWGSWFSGLAPMIDPVSHRTLAVVGMDIPADNYIRDLTISGGTILLLVVVILITTIIIAWTIRAQDRYLQTKALFVSVAYHDIYSPLTGINWASKLLIEKSKLLPPERLAEGIRQSTEHMMQTVDDVSSIADFEHLSQQKVHRGRIDLVPLIHELINGLSLTAEQKQVRLELSRSWPGSFNIFIDPKLFRRAVSNLINTCIKFADEGTTVSLDFLDEAHFWNVSIAASGTGFTAMSQGKLTDLLKSQQIENTNIKGSGFGLFLANQIISRHKGHITVEAADDKNRVFKISMPKN